MNDNIVKRFAGNPILTKNDIPYPVETVHNAAVIKRADEYIMLFRSHLRTGRSIIGLARSVDGFKFVADPEPFLMPATDGPFAAYEEFGVEDPRVTKVDDDYLITYSAYSNSGVRVALAKTRDFVDIERVSLITQADYRNVVIFPEKFNGLYARLDRPHSEISPWSIWITFSPDLVMDGSVYRLGVALHDLNDPAKVIGVGDSWILQPEDPWELTGYVHNVVFSCAAVPEQDGSIKIYWGGADTVMCVGEAKTADLVNLCLQNARAAV